MIANSFRPNAKCSFGCLDRNQLHSATEDIIGPELPTATPEITATLTPTPTVTATPTTSSAAPPLIFAVAGDSRDGPTVYRRVLASVRDGDGRCRPFGRRVAESGSWGRRTAEKGRGPRRRTGSGLEVVAGAGFEPATFGL